MKVVRVTSKVSSRRLAGVIMRNLLDEGECQVEAIGPAAVNQGLKAIIVAIESIPLAGDNCYMIPRFYETELDGKPKTGIAILVKR